MADVLRVILSFVVVWGGGIVGWVLGIAAAKGFSSTALAVFIPPYAWVLFGEFLLEHWPC